MSGGILSQFRPVGTIRSNAYVRRDLVIIGICPNFLRGDRDSYYKTLTKLANISRRKLEMVLVVMI